MMTNDEIKNQTHAVNQAVAEIYPDATNVHTVFKGTSDRGTRREYRTQIVRPGDQPTMHVYTVLEKCKTNGLVTWAQCWNQVFVCERMEAMKVNGRMAGRHFN